ncbi:MAG: DNA polymerase III subunit gamma/tau [Deltaproteobacteria bacterium]|nr:DNA polymerase III subunit gamma/tau [Deltaproteobacteria bacterium]
MAYEVLARKWRPMLFEEVIGQEHITRTIMNAIISNRLAHAYLFSGARGVGKTSVARILARAINCRDNRDGNPCNKCISCTEIINGSSVDVQEIDGASNRGIDEIRELRDNIKYMPSSNRYRVYIIDEVHMLTLPAFNALLKTLEEPPPHVKFIFATTEPHKVPVTILSRCQRFDFRRIPVNLIVKHLEMVTAKEGIDITPSGLSIIAREAEGSMRDAESLLDQVASFIGSQIDDNSIADVLGIIDRKLIFEASGAILDGSADKCIEIVDKVYNYGYDIKEFYRAIMDQFRNLLVSLVAPGHSLLDMTEDDIAEIRKQAESAGIERIQQSLNILINREDELRYSSHPRLIVEVIMIKLSQLEDILSFEELIGKIEQLEKRLMNASGITADREAGQVLETGAGWGEEEVQAIQKAEVSESSPDPEWHEFLEFLSVKSKAMYNILNSWNYKRINGDTLEIERGGNAFTAGYLDDTVRMAKFTQHCREFYKRDIKVKIFGDKPRNGANFKTIKQPDAKGDRGIEVRSDLPRPVQDVLRIFQGEIKKELAAENSNKNDMG